MKVCIPHYTLLADRRVALESTLEKMGIEATWITAFDQEDISAEVEAKLVDQSTLRERAAVTERASGSRKLYPEVPLKKSEMSIALKQLEILRNHADSPDGYIVVIEDDVQFRDENFVRDFQRGLSKTPNDWDLIFFGNSGIPAEKRTFFRVLNQLTGRTVFRKQAPATRCLDSYAIKTVAAHRLALAIDKIALPIDWELNYWLAKLHLVVYWWDPGLTFQGSQSGKYASSIRSA